MWRSLSDYLANDVKGTEADLIVAAGVEEIASGAEIADGARESVREPESKIKSPMMMVAGK